MKTLLMIVSVMVLFGCMSVNHTGVPDKIKADFDWDNLEVADKERLQEKFGGMRAVGTGQYDKLDGGGIHIDTTAKLEVIGGVADTVLKRVSDGAGKAAGMF